MTKILKRISIGTLSAEIFYSTVDRGPERLVTVDLGDVTLTLCECHAETLAELLADVRAYLAEDDCS